MKAIITLVCILTLTNLCQGLTLPSGFKKCDKTKSDFNPCLSTAIQGAIQQLKEPQTEYGLPTLDPFVGPDDMIVEYGDETTGLRQKYTSFKFNGLTDVTSTSASFDFSTKTLHLNITFVEVVVEFDYQISGWFILYPVNVSTTGSCTLIKPLFKLAFNLEEYEFEKQSHYRVAGGGKLNFFPEAIIFDYKDIFKKGSLTEEINKGMSEN
ncbi:uncharacterized protein LOC135126101 [Zophobas morio]